MALKWMPSTTHTKQKKKKGDITTRKVEMSADVE